MKHLLLIAIIFAPIGSMLGMDASFQHMITTIEAAAENKHSITLITSNEYPLTLESSNSIRDGIRLGTGLEIPPGIRLTVCPYACPFFLNEEEHKNPIIPLSINVQRRYYINLQCGPDALIQFGDIVRFHYKAEKSKFYIMHNDNKKALAKICIIDRPLEVGYIQETKK